MPNKKRIFSIIIIFILVILFVILPFLYSITAIAAGEPNTRDWDRLVSRGELRDSATPNTDYAVIMDAHTGQILYEENGNRKRYPASITKIMTCLVVLENIENLSDYVTIAELNINEKNASRIGLQRDEVITVDDLLYGLMLESGNDAGVALAIKVSDSVEAFADLMNEKASELGMTGTHFVNPHGLHDSDHYTTAMDMAKLAYAAMKNPTFRKIVNTYYYTPPVTNKHNPDTNPWYPEIWQNSNRLISPKDSDYNIAFNNSYGHSIGIKTGYTMAASGTLVAAAESKDGTQEVITVVLDDKNTPLGKWIDTTTMFMYAFEYYDTINLAKYLTTDVTISTHVENAADSVASDNLEMYLVPDEQTYLTKSATAIKYIIDSPERITSVEEINEPLEAPINEGDEVGKTKYYLDEEEEPILVCTLIAANNVEAKPVITPEPTPTHTIKPETTSVIDGTSNTPIGMIGYIGYGLAGLAVLIIFITIIILIRRKAKYHQYSVSSKGRYTGKQYLEDSNSDRRRNGKL